MKSICSFIIIILLFGCKPTGYIYFPPIDNKFSINESGYFGNTILKHETFDKGNEFKFIGYYAIDNYGQKSLLKIKECSEYYPNGKLKSRGNYQIGSYIQCCAAGPCKQFYNYKIGEWNYYYSNEQLRAKCEYETNTFHIGTSCEKGDSLKFNIIRTVSAYDELGTEIEPKDDLLNELNSILLGRYYYKLDPINNKRIIIETEL